MNKKTFLLLFAFLIASSPAVAGLKCIDHGVLPFCNAETRECSCEEGWVGLICPKVLAGKAPVEALINTEQKKLLRPAIDGYEVKFTSFDLKVTTYEVLWNFYSLNRETLQLTLNKSQSEQPSVVCRLASSMEVLKPTYDEIQSAKNKNKL